MLIFVTVYHDACIENLLLHLILFTFRIKLKAPPPSNEWFYFELPLSWQQFYVMPPPPSSFSAPLLIIIAQSPSPQNVGGEPCVEVSWYFSCYTYKLFIFIETLGMYNISSDLWNVGVRENFAPRTKLSVNVFKSFLRASAIRTGRRRKTSMCSLSYFKLD